MYRNAAAAAAHSDAISTVRSCGLSEADVGCIFRRMSRVIAVSMRNAIR